MKTNKAKKKSKLPDGCVDLHIALPESLRDKVAALGAGTDATSLAIRGLSLPKRFAFLLSTHPLIANV